jgi:2-iminobutanoate/2-iminopropanoate deaminase
MGTTSLATYGPYSPIFKAGDFYFVSGQVGADSLKRSAEHITGQVRQAIQNLKDVLDSQGLGLEDVIKTTVFLADMNDYSSFNDVYVQYFPSRPARSCVAVSALPAVADNRLLVEIEAVAYKELG